MKIQQQQKTAKRTPAATACLALWGLINTGLMLMPETACLAAKPQEIKFTVNRFKVEGASPLSQQAIDDYFQPLQHKQYNLKELQQVGKGLELAIREQGYPFYRVNLPPQTLSGGEVKLQVISFALGEVKVEGNHYFNRDNIIASLPVLTKPGSPNTQDLSESLKVANKHPSKQLQLTFKQSETADKIDAKVTVAEQRPYQASLIMNNAGTPKSGDYRMTGMLQYSNLWGLDHVLNGSYTTSPDHADDVRQYGVSYSMPVYQLKGWLSAYYAYSNVNIGTVATDITVTGSGEMYGLHYQQFLPKFGKYEHSLDFGLDNRYFINDVQFQNIPLGTNVRSAPVSILYKGEYPWLNTHSSYYLQWVGNTDIGGHNNDSFYNATRFGAKRDWDLLRYGANFSANFNQWLVQTTFTGQYSSAPLIAGEQLGIGGNYDVRGYQQRETSSDSGEIVKFEITTPPWQQINLFAFYDYGHGHLQNPLPGQTADLDLHSTGFGARWQWRENVMANIALASVLSDGPLTQAGMNRVIANIVLRY